MDQKTVSRPVKDSHDTDSNSSLGILDVNNLSDMWANMSTDKEKTDDILVHDGKGLSESKFTEDISDILRRSSLQNPDFSADLELRAQRALARKTLERSTSAIRDGGNSSIGDISHLSSYSRSFTCLDPNLHQNSVGNLSKASSISFNGFHLSGQSTPQASRDRIPSVFGSTSNLPQLANEDLLFEEFTPAEDAELRLLQDELSCRNKFADLPLTDVSSSSLHSSLSGVFPNDISVGSSVLGSGCKKKVTADEFFKMKSENTGFLGYNQVDDDKRPNFGAPIQSPMKYSYPGEETRKFEELQQLSDGVNNGVLGEGRDSGKTISQIGSNSIISMSKLDDLYDNYANDMSPNTIVKNIMKYSNKMKGPEGHKNVAKLSPIKSNPLEEFTFSEPPYKANETKLEINDVTRRLDFDLLGEIPDTRETLGKCRKTDETEIHEVSWIEPKLNEEANVINSHLKVSPQLSAENSADKWISVKMETPYEMCVGVVTFLDIEIWNISNRWLNCSLKFLTLTSDLQHDYKSGVVTVPQGSAVIDPNNPKEAKISVKPLVVDRIRIKLEASLEDVVTQAVQTVTFEVVADSVFPVVEVLKENTGVSTFDFGVVAENTLQHLPFKLMNKSNFPVPVNINICQDNSPFSLSFDPNLCGSARLEGKRTLQLILKPKVESDSVFLRFEGPSIEWETHSNKILELSSKLSVNIDVKCLPCTSIKEISLVGCVGYTKLLLSSTDIHLEAAGVNQPVKQILHMMNAGTVPLKLKFRTSDKKLLEDVLTIEPKFVKLKPSERNFVWITFKPSLKNMSANTILCIEVEPNGGMYEANIQGSVKNKSSHLMESWTSSTVTEGIHKDEISEINRGFHVRENGSSKFSEPLSKSSAASTRSSSPSSEHSKSSVENVSTKFLLKSTKKFLVWGSVDIGSSTVQTCLLRNDTASVLKVHSSVENLAGPFKMLNDNGKSLTEYKFSIYPYECLKFRVQYTPTKVGGAADKITFLKSSKDSAAKQVIPLFGYGGNSKIVIKSVPKDSTGMLCLSLGQLDVPGTVIESTFSIANQGTLDSFVIIKPNLKEIIPMAQTAFTIEPSSCIIPVGKTQIFKVIYRLYSDDLKYFRSVPRDVVNLGNLCIISGDEPTRQRIKRIQSNSQSSETKSLKTHLNLDLEQLCSPLLGETTVLDIGIFNESQDSVRILCSSLVQHEISLIVEKSEDRSFVNSSQYSILDDGNFKSMLSNTLVNINSSCGLDTSWSVLENTLTLAPPDVNQGVIHISSSSNKPQIFEIQADNNILKVEPSEGIIDANGLATVSVYCRDNVEGGSKVNSKIKIFMENDVKEVEVVIFKRFRR